MWRRLFPQRPSDADLEDEFAAHLEIETRQLMQRGMTREQAGAHRGRYPRSPRIRSRRPSLAGCSLCRPHFAPRARLQRGGRAVPGTRNRRHHRRFQHRGHSLPAPAAVRRCRPTRLAWDPVLPHWGRLSPLAGVRCVAPRQSHVPDARRHPSAFRHHHGAGHIRTGRSARCPRFGQLPRCLCGHSRIGPLFPAGRRTPQRLQSCVVDVPLLGRPFSFAP